MSTLHNVLLCVIREYYQAKWILLQEQNPPVKLQLYRMTDFLVRVVVRISRCFVGARSLLVAM